MQLPLYIELKGKRIDDGCGTLTVCWPCLTDGHSPIPTLCRAHPVLQCICASSGVRSVRESDRGDACKETSPPYHHSHLLHAHAAARCAQDSIDSQADSQH